MDETVIKEIANQLGIAADKSAVFIQTYLPQYAALKIIQDITLLSIFAIVIIALSILSYCSYKSYSARYAKRYGADTTYPFFEYIEESLVGFVIFFVLCSMIVIFILLLMLILPTTIGWIMCPEAQLINLCMNAIK